MQEKIKELMRQMTIEEKVALTIGQDFWSTNAIARLGIPSINLNDGPHGVRKPISGTDAGIGNSLPATCFPSASAVASSFDVNLMQEMGEALGEESRRLGVDVLLGPGLNIKRTPVCGRNFEYFSEDPVLAGEMATAEVRGIQSRGVGTSVKHFACNNQEYERMSINVEVDERTLREIYLAGFERVVKAAKPWTVMASYNKVNGDYATENEVLLQRILKGEWEFDGVVVSDWGAVNDKDKALAAGMDLEMPGGRPQPEIVALFENGHIPMSALDAAAERVLLMVEKAAAQREEHDFTTASAADVGQKAHTLARRVAGESIVLLKNEENLLPLTSETVQSVAVLGRFAKQPRFQGAGSSQIVPTEVDIPLEELVALADGKMTFEYADGYVDSETIDEAALREAVDLAKKSQAAVIFAGLPDHYESEGYDRKHMSTPPAHNRLIEEVCRVQRNTVVVLMNGSSIVMPWVDAPKAIVEAWLGGQAIGGAIADVLLGRVNPSGKLAETFPVRYEDTPAYLNYPGELGTVRYGEGLFVGYRYYDAKGVRPLFPFGHGLSYTTFAYTKLALSRETMTDVDELEVSVSVRNTGERHGKEAVQVYVRDVESRLVRPVKELKAFGKVELAPGEERTITFTLRDRDFAYFDPAIHDWRIDSGEFEILVGPSSALLPLKATVILESTKVIPPAFHKMSLVKDFLAHPVAMEAVSAMLPEWMRMNAGADAGDLSFMEAMMMELPLKKAIAFTGGQITEEMLEALISRVNQAG